jgi:hypothetical protein
MAVEWRWWSSGGLRSICGGRKLAVAVEWQWWSSGGGVVVVVAVE